MICDLLLLRFPAFLGSDSLFSFFLLFSPFLLFCSYDLEFAILAIACISEHKCRDQ